MLTLLDYNLLIISYLKVNILNCVNFCKLFFGATGAFY